MRTIDMYQDPKTGIYESLFELAKRNGIRMIILENYRVIEEIDFNFGDMLNALEVRLVGGNYLPTNTSYVKRQRELDRAKYCPERNTGRPLRGNPMPREIKHMMNRRYDRRIR